MESEEYIFNVHTEVFEGNIYLTFIRKFSKAPLICCFT
jgi:hypothetical protein